MGKREFSIVFISLILLSSTVLYSIPSAFANGEAADLALGQPNLISASATLSSITLNAPHDAVIDGSGNVWVTDTNNNRILRYSPGFANGQSADIVLGQPDFVSNAINSGGISAASLSSPHSLTFDGSGNLWVADTGNNRVLRFDAPITNFESATVVIGQSSSTGTAANAGGISDTSLNAPSGLTFDGSGNLWVADSANNRVLKFNSPSSSTGESADLVIGQSVFTTSSSGLSDTALDTPNAVAVDGSGNVWVADTENNRVLKFDTPTVDGEGADLVLGQPNFFSNQPNNLSVTALTLNKPQGIFIDGSDVWVADGSNNRLLKYNSPASATGETADIVLGQSDFTTGDPNFGSLSAARLFSPQSVFFDGSVVWTADSANNRVLRYSTISSGQSASLVLGQPNFTSSTSGAGSLSASTLILPRGVVTDQLGNTWVADTVNNRVLKFSPVFSDGQNAVTVLGQLDFTSNTVSFGTRALSSPSDLAIDHEGNLWVADTGNSRVVMYNDGDANPGTSNFANGQIASLVLGQAGFGTNLPNRGGAAALNTMSFPTGVMTLFNPQDLTLIVAVADTNNDRVLVFLNPSSNGPDAAIPIGGSGPTGLNTLSKPTYLAEGQSGFWVSDTGNNRVLEFDLSQGFDPVTVLGQSDFTSNSPNAFGVSANSLSSPLGLALDENGNLWVGDSQNHRTLLFSAGISDGEAASGVLGQQDFTSIDANEGGVVSATSQSSPSGVAIDSDGNLWLADASNNRVLRYQQLPEVQQEPDADGDGIPDSQDGCPDEAGTEQNNGCPEPAPPGDSEILNAIQTAKDMIMNSISFVQQTVDLIRADIGQMSGDLTNIAFNVDGIQDSINDPEFGLEEIKNEVRIIEAEVDGSSESLANLQTTLDGLESSVNNEVFGLEEINGKVTLIQLEIDGSSESLANLQTTLDGLESSVNNEVFGLEEIKNEVRIIEETVLATSSQITQIQDRLDLLVAIQTQLDDLQSQLDDISEGLGSVETVQRVEISVSRSDGSDEFVVLTTLSGVPVDATYDRILVLNNRAQLTELSAGDFTVTDLDTGLSLLEIDKQAIQGSIRAIELVVSFTDDGTTSHGAILFEDNVDKNTAQ